MLLLLQTYPGGNETLQRHWKYVPNSGTTDVWLITTEGGHCWVPAGFVSFVCGKDSYIDASHLPERLLNTLEIGLASDHEHLLVAEYDCLFFNHIRYQAMEHAVASHRAGSSTWGSKANSFYHNPWLFHREFAERFIEEGRKVISEGICTRGRGQPSTPESSPDVFFGLVCERLNQTVQDNLWSEFSQNSFDIPGTLMQAREAYRSGIDVIHGVKSKSEMEFILS
jgi:hypothetical protein